MKRSPMKQKSAKIKTSKGLYSNYKSEKKGLFPKKQSKDEEWSLIREELIERFITAGIISCELQLIGCIGAYNFGFTWSFAHSLKRREIETEDINQRYLEMRTVIYACGVCHSKIEYIGNKERFDGKPKMSDIVKAIISQRKIQP